jgi:hypothetical protein
MYKKIVDYSVNHYVTLVAVSKTQPTTAIMALYDQGQKIFGENRVQELTEKYEALPKDIEWHLIGHLQKNKVKYIAPFVSMIHSVDSLELLQVIDQQAQKHQRVIPVLLQFHIAQEETKFGLSIDECKVLLDHVVNNPLPNVLICGVMGMGSFTENKEQVRREFRLLKSYFDQLKSDYFSADPHFKEISMGMSGDYEIAIDEGSTMIRVGSSLF